jgi:hypothetical protein
VGFETECHQDPRTRPDRAATEAAIVKPEELLAKVEKQAGEITDLGRAVEGGSRPMLVIPRLESLPIDVAAAKQKWQNRPATIVQLLRLERDNLSDVAKLRGEFPQPHSMQVCDWAVWRIVIDALTPYPKALHAVSLALTDGGEG